MPEKSHCPTITKEKLTFKTLKTIDSSEASYTVVSYNYGPNPMYFNMGQYAHFKFLVHFDTTPPATFEFSVPIKNRKGETVKTLTKTVPTHGQQDVNFQIDWDGTDDNREIIPPGGYGPSIDLNEENVNICSGLQVCANPSKCALENH